MQTPSAFPEAGNFILHGIHVFAVGLPRGWTAADRFRARPSGRRMSASNVEFHVSLKNRHGRTLATITVDGKEVGDILIVEGLAQPGTASASLGANSLLCART